MEKTLHKRITIISLSIIGFVILTTILVLLFTDTSFMEGPGPIVSIILGFSLLSIISSWILIHEEKTWIRKFSKYSLVLFPLVLVASVPILMFTGIVPLIMLLNSIILILILFFLMQLFLFADATALKGNAIFIALIITWLIVKRFHFIFNTFSISVICFLFSVGSYMYGIRCLYLVKKNSFLKYTAFWCSCLITISFIGFLCKVQHWPGGGILKNASYILLILGTLVVLFALPSSGYFDWQNVHKKILKRLIIPWTLLFVFFIIEFMLPGVQKFIFNTPAKGASYSFEMKDYDIENKNGIILK